MRRNNKHNTQMGEQDTLNVPLTRGLPSDRRTGGLVFVTGGRRETDQDGCTVSTLCCAEIDLTFQLLALSDLNSIKLIFCLTH